MIKNPKIAQNFAKEMLEYGIYVIAFSYPVVPKNESRIRVQISSAHTEQQIQFAIDAFKKCGKNYKLI